MSTATRAAEADNVEAVYRWALARVGVGVVADSLTAWNSQVPVTGGTSDAWLSSAWKLVSLRRSWLVRLAMAYYRLVRALRTGSTVALPGLPSEKVSIESLRREFETIVHEIDLHAGGSPKDAGVEPPLPDSVSAEDTKPIPVEELDADVEAILEEVEKDAEDQLKASIQATGTSALQKKLNQLDDSRPARDVDAARAANHSSAGRSQAAAAERVTLQAARGLTYRLSDVDKRVLGWIRYSTTGTPCGWCAMLLSRGFTRRSGLYRSKGGAGGEVGNIAEQFHDNCNCTAVPIFFTSQLDSPLFELNRKYAEEWPRVTKGLSGEDALTEWRKHIRAQQASNQSAAQEAA